MTFAKDQKVTFFRLHDRSAVLSGAVVEVKGDEILIAADPAGVKVWANAADVTPVPAEKPKAAAKAAEPKK